MLSTELNDKKIIFLDTEESDHEVHSQKQEKNLENVS